jgi:hypothetical protein
MVTTMADLLNDDKLREMSDEELMGLDASQVAFNSSEATEDKEEDSSEADEVNEADTQEESTSDDEEDTSTETADEVVSDETSQGDDESKDEADTEAKPEKDGKAKPVEPAKGKQADATATNAASTVDADGDLKSFHQKITAPFKAAGRTMQVKNADEALQLMQMGVGFGKKMEALKPNLALLRMLEKADLLTEEKLSYLIDLSKGNANAVNKLVKDSGIDPLEISAEKAGDYTPGNHRISEQEQALDEVFSSLEGEEGFDRTLDVITNKWDAKSRGLLAQNPRGLVDITQHIKAGVFDAVNTKVERERILGNLPGLSDLEAYRQVGEAMASSGELAHLIGKANQSSQPNAPAKVVVEPKPSKADDDNRREKRKAASPTRASTPSSKRQADFNPLALSDEELMKLDISKFR